MWDHNYLAKKTLRNSNGGVIHHSPTPNELVRVCVCVHTHVCVLICIRLFGTHGQSPARFLCAWNFQGKNTGVGCISYSRQSSWLKNQTLVPYVSCIGRQILYHWATWKAPKKPLLPAQFNWHWGKWVIWRISAALIINCYTDWNLSVLIIFSRIIYPQWHSL